MSDEATEFSDLDFGGMLFDQMALPCAFFRVEYDTAGKPIKGIHLAVNQAYLAMMDRPREELLGHAVEDVIPDIEPIWLSTFAQVAATGVRHACIAANRENCTLRVFSPLLGQP